MSNIFNYLSQLPKELRTALEVELSSGDTGSTPKLDDLAAPEDNTDLNATTSAHGLLPKLDNSAVHFLNGQGGYTTPDHGSIGGLADDDHTQYTLVDGTRGFTLGAIKTGSGTVDAPFTVWNGAGLTATFPSLAAAANGRSYSLTNIHDTYLTVAAGSGDSLHALAHSLVAPGETLEYLFLNDVWYMLGSPRMDPRREAFLFEEFTGNTAAPSETGMSSLAINGATAAMYGGAEMDISHPGVAHLTMNTNPAAAAGINRSNNTGVLFGGGRVVIEALVRLSALSDGTDTYAFRCGFGNTQTSEFTNGVYFEYDTTVSPNWRMVAATNSTRTKTTSSTAVVAGAWIRLKIIVNAAGTSAEYFVNDVSIGTVTTNIPTVSPRFSHFAISMIKSAGTTSRYALIDYFKYRQLFTTPR